MRLKKKDTSPDQKRALDSEKLEVKERMNRIWGDTLKWFKCGAITLLIFGILLAIDSFLTNGFLTGTVLFVIGVGVVNFFIDSAQEEVDSCKDPVTKLETEASQEGCLIMAIWGGIALLVIVCVLTLRFDDIIHGELGWDSLLYFCLVAIPVVIIFGYKLLVKMEMRQKMRQRDKEKASDTTSPQTPADAQDGTSEVDQKKE